MKNEIGNKYGKLTVIARSGSKSDRAAWLCRCDCGEKNIVTGTNLRQGQVKSCGCLTATVRGKRDNHMDSNSPTYYSFAGMWDRCTNENSPCFEHYGGRGISVDDRWRSYNAFLADMGEKPHGLTIERVDNNKGYSSDNCRWATREEQGQNTRRTKLNEIAVRVIRYMHAHGTSTIRLAASHGVCDVTILGVVNRKTWRNA